jgi:SAM-dependent methyltransferase
VTIELSPAYVDLDFMSPLSDARADRLISFLSATTVSGLILDVGCGWGELLLRAVSARPGARGKGIDRDETAVSHGRAQAERRRLAERIELVVGDASETGSLDAAAVICIGASQIWADHTVGADVGSQPLDYRRALTAIRSLVQRGGRVVYGEGIWSTPPTPAAVAPLAGRLDEFVPLAELVDLVGQCGFVCAAYHEASLDEWDAFESGYTACYARWLADHDPASGDADEIRQRARRQREAYLGGYRGVLGMAYLELVAI